MVPRKSCPRSKVAFGAWLVAGLSVLGAGFVLVSRLTADVDDLSPQAAAKRFDPPPADTRAAATVNGAVISERRIQLLIAATQVSGNPVSRTDALDAFIAEELLYQEAVRRGMLPTDSDVQKAIDEVRAQSDPDAIEAIMELNRKAGTVHKTVDDYWKDPERKKSMARDLAIARLTGEVTKDATDGQRQRENVAEEVTRLRSAATVVMFR